jgi:hypothetical protein
LSIDEQLHRRCEIGFRPQGWRKRYEGSVEQDGIIVLLLNNCKQKTMMAAERTLVEPAKQRQVSGQIGDICEVDY